MSRIDKYENIFLGFLNIFFTTMAAAMFYPESGPIFFHSTAIIHLNGSYTMHEIEFIYDLYYVINGNVFYHNMYEIPHYNKNISSS